jgi:predicted metal-binding membrane protein
MTPAGRERARVRAPLVLVSVAVWVLLVEMAHGVAPMIDSMLPARGDRVAPVVAAAVSWALMVVAMMVPLLGAPVGHVRARSFAARRPRAIGLFLAAYIAVWVAAGLSLTALTLGVLRLGVARPHLVAGVVLLAAVWQCAPPKQRCLNRLRAHPELAAFGSAADASALRFGATHALWCVGSCWALMLVALVVPGSLIVMLAVTAWFAAERIGRPRRPVWQVRVPVRAVRVAVVYLRNSSLIARTAA